MDRKKVDLIRSNILVILHYVFVVFTVMIISPIIVYFGLDRVSDIQLGIIILIFIAITFAIDVTLLYKFNKSPSIFFLLFFYLILIYPIKKLFLQKSKLHEDLQLLTVSFSENVINYFRYFNRCVKPLCFS